MKPKPCFNNIRRIRRESLAIALCMVLMVLALLTGKTLIMQKFSGHYAALSPAQFLVSPLSSYSPRSGAQLSKGKFLVASRSLKDPSFSETVVLLIEYERHGAMGLVINRPSEVKLSKVFPQITELQERTDTVFLGGPVARRDLFMLVRSASKPENAHRIFNDIYVSSSRTVLERMIGNTDPGERFRVYAGHAGWAPGQLDHEVSRGAWHILEADAETVFSKAPSKIWPELIRRSSVLWVDSDPGTPPGAA
jgi:putative transcriptional regulator